MTQSQKKKKESGRNASSDMSWIPHKYHHTVALLIIFLSLVVFFRELVFEGKIILAPDDIGHQSFAAYVEDAGKEGIFPLWNPYIFCGMPAYASLMAVGERVFDLSETILTIVSNIGRLFFLNQQNGWQLFYYFVMGVGVYLLGLRKLERKIPAVIAAVATIFSMYIIIWMMSGHGTKLLVMTFFPYVLLLLDRLHERFSLIDAFLLILALHFSLVGAHIQMLFYIFLSAAVYFLFFLVRHLIAKVWWNSAIKAALVFTAATLLAFTMVADRYLSILEYSPYSMRGAEPITQSQTVQSSPKSEGGLDYDYATNWSLGVGELFTMIVPSWYGFGNHVYQGPLSNNQPFMINTYFGPQPFTEAPQYMGIVVLVLACYGFWRNRRDPFVQYLGIMIIFSLLVAFGKELPIVYDLLYSHLPGFNKFRIPSMILVLVQMMVPLLAAYGVNSLLKDREGFLTPIMEKRWKIAAGILGALCVAGIFAPGLFAGIYQSFHGVQETAVLLMQRTRSNPQVGAELQRVVANLVSTDLTVAFGLLALSVAAAYLFLRRSISLTTFAAAILVTVIVDLWRIDNRPLQTQEPQMKQQVFAEPEYVQAIKMQRDSLFRVLEFEGGTPPFNNRLAAWRIQSAYGYQGAKMRRYQDLVDVVGIHNPLLWQIMNVKYIITDQPDSSRWLGLIYDGAEKKVYVNRTVLPRAFFVNRYEIADGMDVLNKMANRTFDPRDVAYLTEDPKVKIDPPLPGMGATFVKYGIQDFVINITSYGNNLLFISEAYYPEGWKAFLDGEEIPIYRANYHFRAVVVPPGSHSLEMKFEPVGFSVGKNASLAANILVLGGLAVVGWNHWRRWKRRAAN